MIDCVGSTVAALEHRLAAGQVLWHVHRRFLCNSRIPLSKRFGKYYITVCRSVLWGCGGWTFTSQVAYMIERFDNHFLRAMCKLRRKVDETWVDYMKRSTSFADNFVKDAA